MVAKDFKDRCIKLQDAFEANLISSEQPTRNVLRRFRHLVYKFDKDMPLNKELDESGALSISNKDFDNDQYIEDVERIREYFQFFIDYIEDYYE